MCYEFLILITLLSAFYFLIRDEIFCASKIVYVVDLEIAIC